MSVRLHGKRIVVQNGTLSLNNLGITSLKEIEGLSEAQGLIALELDGNQIQVLDGLENCLTLQRISLRSNRIHQIQGLDALRQLQFINLAQNQVALIEGLEHLVKLEKVILRNNRIEQVEGLDALVNLSFLDIGHNSIEQINGLDTLHSLQVLDLSGNKINCLEGLSSLGNLKELDLSDNEITGISGLESLSKLQTLNLSHNKITHIQGLHMLKELRELHLDHNSLGQLVGFEGLRNMQKLSLGNNKLTKIQGLKDLTQLRELFLQNNQITKVEGLDFLPALKILNLTQNPLENWPSDIDLNDPRACANNFRPIEPLIIALQQRGYGDFIQGEILEAQFPFLERDILLIIRINLRSGKQQFLMQKISPRTKKVEMEEAIDCIHLVVTPSSRIATLGSNAVEEHLNIRSSEFLQEIQVDIEERFQAFKSWVTGITESGVGAFRLQSSIDAVANVEYPLTGRLLRFAARANAKFIPEYIEYIKRESLYEGNPHESFLIASLDPIFAVLLEKQKAIPKYKKILKMINGLNLPPNLQSKFNELNKNNSRKKYLGN